jgi:hypothetical protein
MPQSRQDRRLLDSGAVFGATRYAWGNHVRGVVAPETLRALCLQLGDTVGRGVYVYILAHLLSRKYPVLTPLVTRVMPNFHGAVDSRATQKGSTLIVHSNRTFLPSGPEGMVHRQEWGVCVQVHDMWRPWELPHHRKMLTSWWDPATMWVRQEYEIEIDEEEGESEEGLEDEDTPRAREQLRRARVQRVRQDAAERLQFVNNRLALVPVEGTGTYADIAYEYMHCLEQGFGRERAYLHLMSLLRPVHMVSSKTEAPEQRLAYCANTMNGKWW